MQGTFQREIYEREERDTREKSEKREKRENMERREKREEREKREKRGKRSEERNIVLSSSFRKRSDFLHAGIVGQLLV